MVDVKWTNFDLLSYSDGINRLSISICNPSINEVSSKALFQINLTNNNNVNHNLTLNYYECLELNSALSKLKDKSFLLQLFELVSTKGRQEFIRNIKKKVLRISFFLTRDGLKQSKIEIYSNVNDILEIDVPISIILSISDLLDKFITDYINISFNVHSIRRMDEIISLIKEEKSNIDIIKNNITSIINNSINTVQLQNDNVTSNDTKSDINDEDNTTEYDTNLMNDFQVFEEETKIDLNIPDNIVNDSDVKKK